jgi:hypothetical protein
MPKTSDDATNQRHKTQPIPGTLTRIPGYPDKLTLYKCDASPYWYVRYYKTRVRRRSTRTTSKREAIAFAKDFYDEINREDADAEAVKEGVAFSKIAYDLIDAKWRRVKRKNITEITAQNAEYRLKRTIIPYFGNQDIKEIGYNEIENFIGDLYQSDKNLTSSTITQYGALVKQVFKHASRNRLLSEIPEFPSISRTNERRPHFTVRDYRRLFSRAKSLIGTRFHYRVKEDPATGENNGFWIKKGEDTDSRLVRTVEITHDLREMVVFMVNSYIRPSDLKNIKHKHVEKRTSPDGYIYLYLKLPPSKKHHKPIITMEKAVDVYERLTKTNQEKGLGVGPDDYFFLPHQTNRKYALRLLQYQLSAVLSDLDLQYDVDGSRYSSYSLRHSSLMYRLAYGDPMGTYLLARNARTGTQMLDKYYLRDFEPEMNVDLLQSKRLRKSTNKNQRDKDKK